MTVFRPKLKKINPSVERMYDVIVAPVVSEKSTMLSEHNKVVFNVSMDSTKHEVQMAVEKLFGVKVKGVTTLIRKGKKKRFKGTPGRRADVKKAFVTLSDGHSIDIATGVVR